MYYFEKIKFMRILHFFIIFFLFVNYICAQEKLKFDANRVFFTTHGNLINVVDDNIKGEPINQNKYFIYSKGWKSSSDTLVWGFDVLKGGKINIYPVLGVPKNQEGSKIKVILNNEEKILILKSTGGYENFEKQGCASFNLPYKGRYEVKLCIFSLKSTEKELAYVKGLDYSCNENIGVEPVVLRWRPTAVHCSFSNHLNPDSIVLAIHENTIMTPWVDCYQPITTPFGYYGSTWDSEKQSFGGINFSLWSFSSKEDIPETHKLSHLIAVGKDLYIDGFNHEGTGVKARGKNPYEGKHDKTQALAIKKIPGNPYDVYYSYYWDRDAEEWKLYGCGKKYNDKGISYLKTGAFVEQPGRAEVERSNHIMRQVNFRGWLINATGKIYTIDKMSPKGKSDINSYKNWGKTCDGSFYMQMGGFGKSNADLRCDLLINSDKNNKPLFLSVEKLRMLNSLPVSISMQSISDITSNTAVVNFSLDKLTKGTKIKLYWGEKDGLTFVKGNKGGAGLVYWEDEVDVPVCSSKTFSYKLNGLKPSTEYYYRLQVVNEDGETWSFDTYKFKTDIQ